MCAAGLERLHRLASTQHGVVTLTQASALGISRSRLRTSVGSGQWTSPTRGLLVATAAPFTWEQSLAEAVLSLDGVVSHRAAARLHGLDGFSGERHAPVEVTIDRRRHPHDPAWAVHRTPTLDPSDVTRIVGLPVTSIARTLVDLGAVVDDDLVEQALDDALRRGVSRRWILATLERARRPGPSGTASLERVLARPDRRGPLPDSVMERLIERLVERADVPPPQRQVEVRDDAGRLVARLDIGWSDVTLGLEAHSERWHWGPRRGRADQRRDNRLAALGWEVLYAGWWDIDDPTELCELLTTTHRRRAAARGESGGNERPGPGHPGGTH